MPLEDEVSSIFQMSFFVQELGHLPVGITVGGFFMITKESVVTVSNKLFTTKDSSKLQRNQL